MSEKGSQGFVSLRKIYKYYDDNEVIHDINLDIQEGEFVVLVGPSGCGKSTTLRVVAGLEEITSGKLFITGREMTDVAPKDRDIAMVFQNYALYPHMTVYKNMAFGLKLRKYSKDEIHRRVRDAAAILGLSDYLDRRPKALSGGERQRVALGRAIVRKPNVFLFDEPLSNLDAKLRVQMRTEIKRLHDEIRTTMIYVTHDQVEAMTMGDRVVVMEDGYIRQIGAPLDIYARPENHFVAGFIGTPPMNFFPANVRDDHTLTINHGSFSINLEGAAGVPAEYAGKDLDLGIRAEDIVLTDQDPDFTAILEVSELLGSEANLHLIIDEHKFIVRTANDNIPATGATVGIKFNRHRIHLFDVDNGQRIN